MNEILFFSSQIYGTQLNNEDTEHNFESESSHDSNPIVPERRKKIHCEKPKQDINAEIAELSSKIRSESMLSHLKY
jgi:hypothetical protein